MSQEAAVVFANEAFYLAFATRDLKSMEEIWSRDAPITCVHPGWRPLIGRDEVMESWATILGNPAAPAVEFRNARAFLYGDVACVLGYEVIQEDVLAASNTFVKEGVSWRLVHHHASPVVNRPEFPDTSPPRGPLM
ncbi:MAG: nuclear transport factor 2 family protein [Thalassobaculaceae bacterium]|nr:nuclear transport factor 2 family protein [Thalassobaculaceae bacterium]